MPRSTWRAPLAAVVLSSCLPFGLGTGAEGSEDTFRRSSLDAYTAYTERGADWRIQDGSLIGRGPAIQSVLVRDGFRMRDGWVEAVSARADDGGLVLRFRGPEDYYLLTFRDDAAPSPRGRENLAVYHRVRGAYRQLWVRDVPWPRGAERTIRFEADDTVLRVHFAGEVVGELKPARAVNDPSPHFGPGGIGVRHYGADASWVTRFEAFRWRSADPRR